MTPEEMFDNNFDCYADTNKYLQENRYVEGPVLLAMTKPKFIEIASLITKEKDEEIERLKFDNKYLSESLKDLLADNKPNT